MHSVIIIYYYYFFFSVNSFDYPIHELEEEKETLIPKPSVFPNPVVSNHKIIIDRTTKVNMWLINIIFSQIIFFINISNEIIISIVYNEVF